MNDTTSSALRISLTALTAAVIAAAMLLGLARLASPPDFQSEVAVVEQRLTRAERLAALPATGGRYPAGAVCSGVTDAELASVHGRLTSSASQAGLVLTDLTLQPSEATLPARLNPVALRIQARGGQDSIMRWLAVLSQSQPEIFVETLDLRSETDVVGLRLVGKVFCWAT